MLYFDRQFKFVPIIMHNRMVRDGCGLNRGQTQGSFEVTALRFYEVILTTFRVSVG